VRKGYSDNCKLMLHFFGDSFSRMLSHTYFMAFLTLRYEDHASKEVLKYEEYLPVLEEDGLKNDIGCGVCVSL
jgi:hypothetical protein